METTPLRLALQHKIGFLGCPSDPSVEWNEANVMRLRSLGFNGLQLNIAWGSRPNGEALNLEDLFVVPSGLEGTMPLLGDQSPARREQRLRELHERAALGKACDFRTLFHFGAPYVGDVNYGDAAPNCLLDGKTTERCLHLLRMLGQQFPEIDDVLIYTYDQHAWLCNEFGPCPRCTGVPLSERVVSFLEMMAAAWRETHPEGRLWWEPWELSAGQVLKCISALKPDGIGLALHCNIAEVMATLPVDRWLKNCCLVASQRNIPVVVEYWLGGPSEELHPYLHLAHPLVTLRGLKSIAAVPGVSGVKEYYGLIPDKEDPNLRMSGLFFANPDVREDDALATLAAPYGNAAAGMVAFWRLTGESMELFPWDTSWLMRGIGLSDPVHAMSAAYIRGVPWHTPSWASTRRAIYMKVDAGEPDAWMLEDVQLRCELAADRMKQALDIGRELTALIGDENRRLHLERNLDDLHEMRRRTLAYVYHLRETNLAAAMRERRRQGIDIPLGMLHELADTLAADQANQHQPEPVASALELLRTDLDAFLRTYFVVVPDAVSKGHVSVTSR